MKNQKRKYYVVMLISIILFISSITILNNTKFIAPIIVVVSMYLLLGTIMKLRQINNKVKNTQISFIDLLFWLP